MCLLGVCLWEWMSFIYTTWFLSLFCLLFLVVIKKRKAKEMIDINSCWRWKYFSLVKLKKKKNEKHRENIRQNLSIQLFEWNQNFLLFALGNSIKNYSISPTSIHLLWLQPPTITPKKAISLVLYWGFFLVEILKQYSNWKSKREKWKVRVFRGGIKKTEKKRLKINFTTWPHYLFGWFWFV